MNIVLKLPPDELRIVFYPKTAEAPPDWKVYFEGQIDHWVKELRRLGVTLKLLWEEYKIRYPKGYGYLRA